jgi:peptidoglycan/xylan/chitin deacetylase (PgdA/CDA1 family)
VNVASAQCGPEALGTHRTLQVSQSDGPIGRFNYRKTLELGEKELVLTFDDGPMPGKTPAVLKALAAECVKATFFVVGSMVAHYPAILRQTAAAGHTIGTHTWNHGYLHRIRSMDRKVNQIAGGLHAANIVLGHDLGDSLSPLFRFPGLGRTRALDRFVQQNGLISMSIDIDSQDWKKQTSEQVMSRTLARIEARGKGIVLMHDIQGRTVAMLPEFLRELKARGYRIVHVTADPAETKVALASLAEPQTRTFQVVMARTKERLQVLTAATAVAAAEPVRAEVVRVAEVSAPKIPGFQQLGLRR